MLLKLQLDLTKEYGLALEGGGAKGSYQVGAWKALKEAGVVIKGIAGTSVGALNGAMICMDNLEMAEYLWENITCSQVMDIDDTVMECVQARAFTSANLALLAAQTRKVLKEKGLDITPLRELVESTVDEERIRASDRELYVTVYSLSDRKCLTVDVKALSPGEMGHMLLASAYLPVFKPEKQEGRKYLDGGGWNNVPIDVLLERGYEDLIVLRIYGLGFDTEKVVKIPEGTRVYHIAPRQSLGGILKFDKKQARKNMKLGYFDGLRLLYGLEGRWYYLDAPEPEEYYAGLLLNQMDRLKELIAPELAQGEESGKPAARYYMEDLFPRLAGEWKLKETWDYKELYLAILEHAARRQRLGRFQVYTPKQLFDKLYSALPFTIEKG